LKEALLVPQSMRTSGGMWGMQTLRAMFLTHLHSDHLSDYFNLFLYGWYNGLVGRKAPVQVYGPGRRGVMEPVHQAPGKQRPAPPVINPDDPTPGTVDMTASLYRAFALDENDRMRDNGKPDLRTLMSVQDIGLPKINGYDPNTNPSPMVAPFKVYEDDNVKVTATLVNHFPIVPAFAFRFDTEHGSVVFSGDTNRNDNLIRMAQGADYLVHEVIDPAWTDQLIPDAATPAQQGLKHHLLTAHTPIDQVGKVAQAAHAKTLVLSHIVPGNAPESHLKRAQQDYSGELIIGKDLMQLPLPRR
jgi:ribonuclease BN (tRNA processing enzyme)